MICLPLEQINRAAPYKIKGLQDGSVFFTTDNSLHYIVSFDPDDVSLSHICYQLVIVNVDNLPSPRDIKLRDTIIAIVEGFFASNNEVMLYICETGDGKQAMRNRLFQYWYSCYERKQNFTFLSASIKDEEGVINYATLIIRNDNPNYTDVVNEFALSIKVLNDKPKE